MHRDSCASQKYTGNIYTATLSLTGKPSVENAAAPSKPHYLRLPARRQDRHPQGTRSARTAPTVRSACEGSQHILPHILCSIVYTHSHSTHTQRIQHTHVAHSQLARTTHSKHTQRTHSARTARTHSAHSAHTQQARTPHTCIRYTRSARTAHMHSTQQAQPVHTPSTHTHKARTTQTHCAPTHTQHKTQHTHTQHTTALWEYQHRRHIASRPRGRFAERPAPTCCLRTSC